MAPRPVKRPVSSPRRPPAADRGGARVVESARGGARLAPGLIHGRNAVLEAARAGRVVRVYQASGLGHDPRLDELARLVRIEVVEPARLDVIAPGVHQGMAVTTGTVIHPATAATSAVSAFFAPGPPFGPDAS